MPPSIVSDTFAFACRTADAWEIVHADPRTDLGLDDEAQVRGFQAAKAHVDASVDALLTAAWQAFAERASTFKKTTRYEGIGGIKPKSTGLVRDSYWSRHLVGVRGHLWVGSSIELNESTRGLELYASVSLDEARMEELESALQPPPRGGRRVDGDYYVGGLEITEGAAFAELAATLLLEAWPVIERASLLVSPRGPKAKVQ